MHAHHSSTIPFIPAIQGDSTDHFEMLCAADHPARPVEWLWPNRIPIGKVTLLVGDPGLGKSLVALDVAARVSRGAPWPDQERQGDKEKGRQGDTASKSSPSLSPCLPVSLSSPPNASATNPNDSAAGSVLILSAEDDLADTIRPRLDAHGADASRVFVLPSITDLRHDFEKLRAAVDRAPNCRLIIVDPVNSYVGPSDSHFHSVVRRVLAPLAKLATEKGIAVLAVTHLRKNDGAAIQRAAGSMGFVAAARAVWTVCRDNANASRNLFLPIKNNLTATACGLAYTIEPDPESGAPAIAWHPDPVSVPAAEALRPTPKPVPKLSEREEARRFLRQALADGPCPADRLIEEGRDRGFHCRTLQRAFHDLEGHTAKRGWKEGWWWSLGDYSVQVDLELGPEFPVTYQDVTYEQDVAYQAKFDKIMASSNFDVTSMPAESQPTPTLSPSTSLSASHHVAESAAADSMMAVSERLPHVPLRSSSSAPTATSPPPPPMPNPTSKRPTLSDSIAYLDRARHKRRSPHPASAATASNPKSPPPQTGNVNLARLLLEELERQSAAKATLESAANALSS